MYPGRFAPETVSQLVSGLDNRLISVGSGSRKLLANGPPGLLSALAGCGEVVFRRDGAFTANGVQLALGLGETRLRLAPVLQAASILLGENGEGGFEALNGGDGRHRQRFELVERARPTQTVQFAAGRSSSVRTRTAAWAISPSRSPALRPASTAARKAAESAGPARRRGPREWPDGDVRPQLGRAEPARRLEPSRRGADPAPGCAASGRGPGRSVSASSRLISGQVSSNRP